MDLYDNPELHETSAKDLGNGWWLGSHLSADEIRKRIKKAREISGVGSRLELIEE